MNLGTRLLNKPGNIYRKNLIMIKQYIATITKVSTAVLLLLSIHQANAQLTTSNLFSNHMVLQRNQQVAIWGWYKKNGKVAVNFNGQNVSTKADKQGYWKAMLQPMKEGGPYVMDIMAGNEHIHYNDVMLGEVWICSGQSNMEFAMRTADTYQAEQKVADQQPVRQLFVNKRLSIQPEQNVVGGPWVKASSNTLGDFTAVGYYFAKQLAAQLHVTVGLVNSTWGGTQAESWISKPALLSSPELKPIAEKQPDNLQAVEKRVEQQIRAYAYKNQPETSYTISQLAAEPASFFNNWQAGSVGAWMWQGKWTAYRGAGFMQRTIKLDSMHAHIASTLHLGQTDADMELYINGKLIFKGALPKGQPIQVPDGTWSNGENSLVLELLSQQKDPAWFGLGLLGDANDINLRFADTTISMADNKWHMMPDWSKPYHIELMPNNTVATLYNGMIHPLIPLSIAGVAWYQGESNVGRAYQYQTVLPLLIKDWRHQWKTTFPFLIMQLPSYGPMQNSNEGSQWAELREAQATALKLPNTAMTVTIDLGDPNNLHPTHKVSFGYRMAGTALNYVYHLPGYYLSPMFSGATFSPGYAVVSFNQTGNGLTVKDKYGYLKGFELAGADHKFYYAKVEVTGGQVKVWCKDVPQPVAVRYAWSDSPVDANLFIKAGLPVAPFRSDNWPGITINSKLTE